MRRDAVVVICLVAAGALAEMPVPHQQPSNATRGSIFLAGQRVDFDASFAPSFTARQTRATDGATRAGLARFAATGTGRKLLAYITAGRYEIDVGEDFTVEGAGRAPEPGIATLVAAGDPGKIKTYSIVLNPASFALPAGARPLAGQPATSTDLMAAAWAAEILHVYFYTRGIPLPHHGRADFQEEWRSIAAELGFPGLEHDDRSGERRRRVPSQ